MRMHRFQEERKTCLRDICTLYHNRINDSSYHLKHCVHRMAIMGPALLSLCTISWHRAHGFPWASKAACNHLRFSWKWSFVFYHARRYSCGTLMSLHLFVCCRCETVECYVLLVNSRQPLCTVLQCVLCLWRLPRRPFPSLLVSYMATCLWSHLST